MVAQKYELMLCLKCSSICTIVLQTLSFWSSDTHLRQRFHVSGFD